jgi:hypothetical protein
LELFQWKSLLKRWKKWFGAEIRNRWFGGAFPHNGLAQQVTRGKRFEVLNGHLANEHVQLAVQLRARAHGVTLIIWRGLTYSNLVGHNLAYAETVLLADEEECQLRQAYLVATKCICYIIDECGHEWHGFFCTVVVLCSVLVFSEGSGSGLVLVCVSLFEHDYTFLINNVHLEENGWIILHRLNFTICVTYTFTWEWHKS